MAHGTLRHWTMVAALLAVGTGTGCTEFLPGGSMLSFEEGPVTYWSTEISPKTVTLYDVREEEPIFVMDIPPGRQLVIDFEEGLGDDPVYTPDLMLYDVVALGVKWGELRSAMTVPPWWSRRLEVTIREGIEYAARGDATALRTDSPADRPDWWTPVGGPLPDENPFASYDD